MTKNLDLSKNTTSTVETPHIKKNKTEVSKEALNALIAEETRMVKGRFRCLETPGASVKIIVRKYPGIPHFEKEMTDNEIYEVPLYVARHLQGIDKTAKSIDCKINSCAYPVQGYKMNSKEDFPSVNMDKGITVPIVYKRRYSFESLEFENVI